MGIAVRYAVFLSLILEAGLFATSARAQSNPYMPSTSGGRGVVFNPVPDLQQQQALQSLLAGPDGGDPSAMPAPSMPPTPLQQGATSIPNADLQALRNQQTDDAAAVAREQSDREQQIKALKDAFDAQIHEMQRRLDKMQSDLDDMRYKNHL